MMTVMSFHGFASGPQGPSPKTDLLRELGYDVALIATYGDYRPAGYRAAFARLGLEPTVPLALMGTSLGGFWARRLGQELGRPWIAMNPAIQPSQSLRRYLGIQTRFDTGGTFTWTTADCGGMWRRSRWRCGRTCRACSFSRRMTQCSTTG